MNDPPDTAVERLATSRRSLIELAAWSALGLLLAIVSLHGLTHDIVERDLRGDQASHVLQAISLADWPPDLSFDGDDFAEWQSLGWAPGPDGLLLHREGNDLTAAKPYGYSLVASFFVRFLGTADGMATTNVALFLANVAIVGRILAWRLRGAVVPLTLGAFTLASTLYLNIHVTQPELFLAALSGVVCLSLGEAVQRAQPVLLGLTFVTGAFLITERLPIAALIVPLLAWALWQEPGRRHRRALLLIGGLTLVVATLPYLETTGGTSVTAYGGDRLYLLPGSDSWPPDPTLMFEATSGRYFTVDHVVGRADPGEWGNIGRAAMYTFVGRNTGMLVFTPMALFALLAALATAPWRERTSLRLALTAAVLVYLSFHAVLITDDFWGGGQTLGNKYVLQVLPAFAAMLALSPLSPRAVTSLAGAAIALAIAGLGPKLWHPEDSLWAVWQTTALQEVLPYEHFAVSPQIYPPAGDG